MRQSWQWVTREYRNGDRSVPDISQAAGVPVGTIYVRMHREKVRRKRWAHGTRICRRRSRPPQMDRPMFRCECGSKSRTPVCPRGHVINEVLRCSA